METRVSDTILRRVIALQFGVLGSHVFCLVLLSGFMAGGLVAFGRQAAWWHGAVAVVLLGGDCLGLGPSFATSIVRPSSCLAAAGQTDVAESVLVVGAVPSSCLVAGLIVIEWRSQNQGCVWQ